ncbi:MAG: hypothetical protein RIR04_114, partial [Pseudomonadota bacterium]
MGMVIGLGRRAGGLDPKGVFLCQPIKCHQRVDQCAHLGQVDHVWSIGRRRIW